MSKGPEWAKAQYSYIQMLLDAGCVIKSRQYFFGKPYVWLKSPEGELFLERIPDDSEMPPTS